MGISAAKSEGIDAGRRGPELLGEGFRVAVRESAFLKGMLGLGVSKCREGGICRCFRSAPYICVSVNRVAIAHLN